MRRTQLIFTALLATVWLLLVLPVQAQSAAPAWLEPKGIHVADLVGLIPEAQLQELIVVYQPGEGMVQYVSGERDGDTVTITVSYDMNEGDEVLCLGKPARLDEWASIQPGGTMRIFSAGQDVTADAVAFTQLWEGGMVQPMRGYDGLSRYHPIDTKLQFDANGAIILPPNSGCEIELSGTLYHDLTAVFTLDAPQKITLTPIFSESQTFNSFISGESSGYSILQGLLDQVWDRFRAVVSGGRHGGFWYPAQKQATDLQGADYVLVKFPPAFDQYATSNQTRPDKVFGGRTYRIRGLIGNTYYVSIDHINGMLIPMGASWVDHDLKPGTSLTLFEQWDAILYPEYVLPPDVAYQPCMTAGNCPSAVLDTVFTTQFPMEVFFYKVERTTNDLQKVPLRTVGQGWEPCQYRPKPRIAPAGTTHIYLPFLKTPGTVPTTTPCQPSGLPIAGYPGDSACPCGWFDETGRMYDFTP